MTDVGAKVQCPRGWQLSLPMTLRAALTICRRKQPLNRTHGHQHGMHSACIRHSKACIQHACGMPYLYFTCYLQHELSNAFYIQHVNEV